MMEHTLKNGAAAARPATTVEQPKRWQGATQPDTWDLSDLYSGPNDPQLRRDEEEAIREAEEFASEYRGRIACPGGPDPELVAQAMVRYEAILERAWRPFCYARLLHWANTSDAVGGALYSRTQGSLTRVQTVLMFFEVDWISLGDNEAAKSIESPLCERWKHFLSAVRRWKPHTLSEPEEVMLAEKRVTGVLAFRRLFDEIVSSAKFEVETEGEVRQLSQSEALALLYSPEREVRRAGHRGFSAGLERLSHLLAFIFNNGLQDHAVDMRLKRFERPDDSRHLSNEIDAECVAALMKACEAGNRIVHEYYDLKRRLLGLDALYDYDRYAPVRVQGVSMPDCSWGAACDTVVEAFHDFSPLMGEIAEEFLRNRWVDAEIRPGKRGGAFCAATVPSCHSYILTNFMGKLNDAMTLAHEMGHGVHQYLAREQGILEGETPLILAETASVFGETLVFERLVSSQQDPRVKLALYCNRLEDTFATVFRQIALTRFEEKVHAARAAGELSLEDFDLCWLQANQPMFGETVRLSDGYKRWWSYISHFIHSPFYCYAYSFGELLVLALWKQHLREGSSFIPKYLDLLRAGGSDTPARLIRRVGLDIHDPGFWADGISVVSDLLKEAERLADEVL